MGLSSEERSVDTDYVSTYNVFAENIHRKQLLSVDGHIRRRISYKAKHRNQSQVFSSTVSIKEEKTWLSVPRRCVKDRN
jgi:hypothetical protein